MPTAIRRLAVCLPILAVLVLFSAAPAPAADSLAPAGAARDWLPHDKWVLNHWLPYDEQQLLSALHMSRNDVRQYFQGPRLQTVPPLAALARQQGMSVPALARRLVRSWHPRVSRRAYLRLVRRATLTLTQGHLMQHMMFHTFHDQELFFASPQIFGVQPRALNSLLRQGWSRREIGHSYGHTDAQMLFAATSVLRRTEAWAVRHHLTPAAEAKRELALQLPLLNQWLDFAGKNAANPQAPLGVFGKASSSSLTGPLYYCHF